MTELLGAIAEWRELKQQMTVGLLNNEMVHAKVHELSRIINNGLKAGLMTYDEMENRVNGGTL